MNWHSAEAIHFAAKMIEISGLSAIILGGIYSIAVFIANLVRKSGLRP